VGLQKFAVFEAARSRSYAECFWLNKYFGRFVFSGRSECAPEIYQRQFRLHFVSARQAAFTRHARARRCRSAVKKIFVLFCVKGRGEIYFFLPP
jgi:hypothetical protein